jgi:hypothetical protein
VPKDRAWIQRGFKKKEWAGNIPTHSFFGGLMMLANL